MGIFDVLIVQPIFNLLIGLYSLIPGGDFGISLILFTILVRFALWPLTKKQLHQTKAMRKLQPELAKIKKRNKGNKQMESMQMLELYKKHGVSPFRSLGILLIQLPIFIGLFRVLQIFAAREQIDQYTYGFMSGLEPVRRILANPDQFEETLFGVIDLTQRAIGTEGISVTLLVIAITASILQYVMSRQTMPKEENQKRLRDIMAEAAEGKQADQAEMNAVVMRKMMKVLPIFLFFVMINFPGALVLYYAVSNMVAVGQQYVLLKQDEKELVGIAGEKTTPKSSNSPAGSSRNKKSSAKQRADKASEANITRIKAKDSRSK